MAYPSEYVIRMLKGYYPRLNLKAKGYEGKSILDISCGDTRNFGLFKSLGFGRICGTEISQEIVDNGLRNAERLGIDCEIRVGRNNCLGFEDDSFDYILSWNVCYYMDDEMDFSSHVREYARVMRKNGILIFSIPCPNCFIYKNAVDHGNGFFEITDDWFDGRRNGSWQRVFKSEDEIVDAFSSEFKDFVLGGIHDDCFGLNYDWYIGYCVKI